MPHSGLWSWNFQGLLYQCLYLGVGSRFVVGLLCDFQCLIAVGPRSLPEHVSILALPLTPDSSQCNLWAIGALPNTTSYQGAAFYHHPSLSNCSCALLSSWQYYVTTWVPKTIQSQDRTSSGNPPHKKAVVHNMTEGRGSWRKLAFVWGTRQFSHLQTCWRLRFFLVSVPEFFSPLLSATYPFSLVISELPWVAGMQGQVNTSYFLQPRLLLFLLFSSPRVLQFTFPLDNGKSSVVIDVAK